MELFRTPDSSVGARQLCDELRAELQAGKSVLWLIPGGSNIPVSVQIMDGIDASLSRRLTLALTDERYGEFDHPDSNWRQLREAGFDPKAATTVAVLPKTPVTLEACVEAYGQRLSELFSQNNVVLGQFGMGADGHLAGILPGSPAASASGLVAGYQTATFTRITLTFEAIKHCQAAWLFAFGDEKRQALSNLQRDRPLAKQPAQILKQLPAAYVYNDQIGKETA